MSATALAKARELYSIYKDSSKDLLDIDAIINGNKIEIIPWDFPDHIRGCIAYENQKAYMGINSTHIEKYKNLARFTKAHELAHFFLHNQIQNFCIADIMNCATRKNNRLEWEANIFAAEILMPSQAIKKVHKKMTTAELSNYFSVSTDAIIYKLNNMGLI